MMVGQGPIFKGSYLATPGDSASLPRGGQPKRNAHGCRSRQVEIRSPLSILGALSLVLVGVR